MPEHPTFHWKPKTLEEARAQVCNPQQSYEWWEQTGRADADTILSLCPSGYILDFGCGIGRVLKYLPPERADGYEPHEDMQKFIGEWAGNRHTIFTSLEGLVNRYYQLVVENLVWQHNNEETIARDLATIHRTLVPGGLLAAQYDLFKTNPPQSLIDDFEAADEAAQFSIWRKRG